MDEDTFCDNLIILKEILSSEKRISNFILQIEKKMKEAASLYRYETASYYRDLMSGLQYMKHGINGYQILISKTILLKIPTQNGFKLFLVNHGMIQLKENYASLTDSGIKSFIQKGQALALINKIDNEKSYIDFRDILYSEIMSLEEDIILILD